MVAFQQLEPTRKKQFLCLRDNSSRYFKSMNEAFAENSFQAGIPDVTGSQSNKPPAHGLYLLLSRFNHSCIPNSKIPTTNENAIACFATKDIAAGEEITFCYNTDFECRTRHERHEALRFVCHCRTCSSSSRFTSDLRRRFIRGLQYLTHGVDIDGQRQRSGASVIANHELKEAAENGSIPLSSRLIYNVLVMVLIEKEGLLDDFMLERMRPSVFGMAAFFTTRSNIRIVRLMLEQGSWSDKLFMAFNLYGRKDASDHDFAGRIRALRGLP